MALRFLFLFLFLALLVLASLSPQASADSGTAGFINPPYTPSECYENTDMGWRVASVSDDIWSDGSVCGTLYQVQCTGGTNDGPQPCNDGSDTVKVMVTDHCVSCTATMMLSKEAFTSIANPSSGIVAISYQIV